MSSNALPVKDGAPRRSLNLEDYKKRRGLIWHTFFILSCMIGHQCRGTTAAATPVCVSVFVEVCMCVCVCVCMVKIKDKCIPLRVSVSETVSVCVCVSPVCKRKYWWRMITFRYFPAKGHFLRWKVLCVIYCVWGHENRKALPLILLFVPVYSAYFVPQKRPFYIQACE